MEQQGILEFCRRVTAQVRHATPEEKQSIEAELSGHMEDRAEVLRGCGYTEEEAAERALQAMGDAEEIGRRLNREYPLHWLVLSRVTLFTAVAAALIFAANWGELAMFTNSLQARFCPQRLTDASELENRGCDIVRDVDIRTTIGGEVVRIYRVGMTETAEGLGRVSLAICNYDENLFGRTAGRVYDEMTVTTRAGVQLLSEAGQVFTERGGGVIHGIPVDRSDDALILRYEAYGEKAELRLALAWEEIA